MSTIIRVKKRHRYVSLDPRLVEDERLPWAARGVLVYLLAKPDDWTIRVEDLRRRGDLGRDAIYTVFEVLRRYGYLHREQHRDARGRLAKTLYTVFEVPVESPLPETPDTARPCPVKPTLPNNQRTQEPIKQITTTTTTEDKVPTEPNVVRGSGDDIDFEYPPGLSTAEITEAKKKLTDVTPEVAQQLLDELAGRMAVNAIRVSPLAYLRGLVNRATAGDYSPEAALAIAAKRNARRRVQAALQRTREQAPSLPETDPSAPIARRIAAIRSATCETRERRATNSASPSDSVVVSEAERGEPDTE